MTDSPFRVNDRFPMTFVILCPPYSQVGSLGLAREVSMMFLMSVRVRDIFHPLNLQTEIFEVIGTLDHVVDVVAACRALLL